MAPLSRLAFIGNSLPRQCGIATFTTDLRNAVAASAPNLSSSIVAMTDHGRCYDYPPSVCFQIADDRINDYSAAAEALNRGQYEVVSLQHEYGIFGGAAGSHLSTLLARLTMPVVTTLHTVLAEPSEIQRDALKGVVAASSKVVVMAEKAHELLRTVYGTSPDKIEIIPHGIPNFPFVEPDEAKAKLGFVGRAVILTFGLLSPNKGIEIVIEAMPSIIERRPDAIYVVLGATHPNLVRDRGEAYRESLLARVRELGLDDHVLFLNQFVDQDDLLEYIAMCDVYVSPYLGKAQMTSGTLAFSFGLGKAVVSTPYWHAQELLADGRGILVPFGDSEAVGSAIAGLLTDDARRRAMGKRAYASSRSMTWDRTAERYLATFESARSAPRLKVIERPTQAPQTRISTPQMRVGHFLSMCDDTGLFQHAIHCVPDRRHGYCIDDNARALLLASTFDKHGEKPLPDVLTARFAAFVQHAWNPSTRRFRNFMSFERLWLEDRGSEDSHGRTLWALGRCAHDDATGSRRAWAAALFAEALPTTDLFSSPRSWAFALLGLEAYCIARPEDASARLTQRRLADRLMALLAATEDETWVWFEDGLAYDNARLPQALIAAGSSLREPTYGAAGLRTLKWLMTKQTSRSGLFRPVGSQSFGDKRKDPQPFDQQPLEACATVSACLAAWRAEGDMAWRIEAGRAFAWFLGANDLAVPLVDLETGSCRDGLHPDRANENRGGESVVSYLISLAEIRHLSIASGDRPGIASVRAAIG